MAKIVGPDAVLSAAAVGLVIEVWRSGPVENMHAGRRGPGNAGMFAESTALHAFAVIALTASNRTAGLRDFEEHLLDRERPWAGNGGRTLPDLGYGFLGDYRRHVKDRINELTALADHTCVPAPLETYLIPRAFMRGLDHVGMPGWPVVVDRIGMLLADPDHPRWGDDRRGHQALEELPAQVTSISDLTATLLTNPSIRRRMSSIGCAVTCCTARVRRTIRSGQPAADPLFRPNSGPPEPDRLPRLCVSRAGVVGRRPGPHPVANHRRQPGDRLVVLLRCHRYHLRLGQRRPYRTTARRVPSR